MMKNKHLVFNFFIISLLFIATLLLINRFYIKKYESNYNKIIGNIVFNLKEEYPDLDETEIINILNNKHVEENDYLLKYGIDISEDSISISNEIIKRKMFITDFIIISVFLLLLFLIIYLYNLKRNKEIRRLTFYVEEINRKNYKLDILSNKEDNISILQNEIYKTMVMLRESAENSYNDKISLKDSLSDISHQLKTPLTSISVLLDNIIDDPNMDEKVRTDFILNIKREIININFLVLNILKLSKFETNTVKFKKEKINIDKLLDDVKKNVDVISDLKNITININCKKDININGDYKWEVEALTNIVKNSIEHSKDNGKIDIEVLENKAYTSVIIKDYGHGISKDNLKYIFERFYKVSDADTGFGIGLSLAKMIIETDNGLIKVSSKLNEGTTFEIRYKKY